MVRFVPMRTLVFESCLAGLKPFVDPSNLSVLREGIMMIRTSDIVSVFFLSR